MIDNSEVEEASCRDVRMSTITDTSNIDVDFIVIDFYKIQKIGNYYVTIPIDEEVEDII